MWGVIRCLAYVYRQGLGVKISSLCGVISAHVRGCKKNNLRIPVFVEWIKPGSVDAAGRGFLLWGFVWVAYGGSI